MFTIARTVDALITTSGDTVKTAKLVNCEETAEPGNQTDGASSCRGRF